MRSWGHGWGHTGHGVLILQYQLVVGATVDHALLHAEVVAGGEGFVTRGAGKAADVIYIVPGPHHQLVRRDTQVTPRASLHSKSSGGEGKKRKIITNFI